MRIAQMVKVYIFESFLKRVRIPLVYKSRASLQWLCLFARKCDEMDTHVIKIMDCQSCNCFTSFVHQITPYGFRVNAYKGTEIAHVIRTEHVRNFCLEKGIGKYLMFDTFDTKLAIGEKLFSCTFGTLVPFLLVIRSKLAESSSHKMCTRHH